MLRSLLIYLSAAGWARRIVTGWVFARRAASRFVAGEKLSDALPVVKALNEKGIYATLDMLGEHTTSVAAATSATQGILEILDAIDRSQLKANVSIKLSQIGMNLDRDLCAQNLARILTFARERGNFVRIDMEESAVTSLTLELYRQALAEGFRNTGIVLQAYLYRTEEDLRQVAAMGGRVRLCKGAYKEAAEVAFPKKADVDANYDRLVQILIQEARENGEMVSTPDGRFPAMPAIASHDQARIDFAKQCARDAGLPQDAIEFQMLYGIRRDIQDALAAEGYSVRVYVPFGTEWYPYSVRRLAERPANLWFFVSNFFRR
jgi:proline dehydrogenase